ncbi:hypothetical protein EVAR_99312_1 [Eumeta japonica]|uniref:Uncharacterized protein n=1 Tax=Eumeta variegata TaxID=151549 RepID=A0A4C1YYW6_EUMVA|nr:hypothetical protein EVAR_99312_1 [Eumeta japonica]
MTDEISSRVIIFLRNPWGASPIRTCPMFSSSTTTERVHQQESCPGLQLVFGDEAASSSTARSWSGLFKCGRDHLFDDVLEGRLSAAATQANIDTVL